MRHVDDVAASNTHEGSRFADRCMSGRDKDIDLDASETVVCAIVIGVALPLLDFANDVLPRYGQTDHIGSRRPGRETIVLEMCRQTDQLCDHSKRNGLKRGTNRLLLS